MAKKLKKKRASGDRRKKRRVRDSSTPSGGPRRDLLLEPRDTYVLGLTLIVAAVYFVYSTFSDGFYQHDEAAHFLNMRGFWHDPNSILGNWAKPGYKLIFVVPALLGPKMVVVVNCLVAALACYVAYKLALALGSQTPILAFVLLAFQPFWLQLSFRNYSEPISALLLVLALFLHHKNRTLLAALTLSYTSLIRQEFYPIIFLYGLYLVSRKQVWPTLALLCFPILNNLWGWTATSDPLYLMHQILGHTQKVKDVWVRQGFQHYFVMSLTIFGAVALTMFIVYLGQLGFYRQKAHLFVLVPLAVYFLEHSIFNLRAFRIGPSTGGNLRYMIVIAPLVAVLGAIAAERLLQQRNKVKLLYVLVPFAMVVVIFMKYKHNNIVLTREVDPVPVLTALLMIAGVFLPWQKRSLLFFLGACAVGFALVTVHPFRLTAEDSTMKQVADWARNNDVEEHHLLVNHTLFYYFYGKSRFEFPKGAAPITKENVTESPTGTYILWDSHYSYRPELHPDHLNYTYFLQHSEQFHQVRPPFVTADRRFGLLVFEKVAE